MMELWPIVEENVALLFCGAVGWIVLWLIGSAFYRKWKGKALLASRPSDAQFVEAWTSGHSNRSLLTRLGGARNCLLVAITPTSLVVRPHFPFSLLFLPEIYDLEYVIPRRNIQMVTPRSGWLGKTIEIAFSVDAGDNRSIELRLRQPEIFLQAVRARGL
jgi:hypothetical protein